jgi:hypothetical protein
MRTVSPVPSAALSVPVSVGVVSSVLPPLLPLVKLPCSVPTLSV